MTDDSRTPHSGMLYSKTSIANVEFDFPDDLIDTTARIEASVMSDDLTSMSGMLSHWWANADFSDPEMAYYTLLDFNELFGWFVSGMLALMGLVVIGATFNALRAVKRKLFSGDES